MSAKMFLPGLLLVAAGSLGAQATPVTGAFVSMLGTDTLSVERYTRTGDKLEGDVLQRFPRVQIVHYVADLSDGKFKGMSVATRRITSDATSPPVFAMMTLLADSIATIEVQRNGRPDTTVANKRVFRGRAAPSVPGVPPAFGLYEQILVLNPPAGRDSVVVAMLGAGAGPNASLSLSRRSRDTVLFVSSFAPGWVEIASVDATGRITGVDASSTTVKTLTKRVPALDFDAIAKGWAAYEAQHGPAGRTSRPDTVRATVGTANVEIAYSRPAKRGRVIFGSVVPWNQVWRTGANAATQLTTTADLMFGNTLVPAGKYTLWSLPTPTGAKLIINSQTGQWGTEYDMKRDLARLDMVSAAPARAVEDFTISVTPQGSNGTLRFAWDDREYSIPFRVK